jgi:hypothetical protein
MRVRGAPRSAAPRRRPRRVPLPPLVSKKKTSSGAFYTLFPIQYDHVRVVNAVS